MAGLKVLGTISEPTAAALNYGLDQAVSDVGRNVLVFDLGGGTFDVSIVYIGPKPEHGKQREFNVLATGGDCHLGGEDFDVLLWDYCAKKFNEDNVEDLDAEIHRIPNARAILHRECVKAKE